MGIRKMKGTYPKRVELVQRYLRNEISLRGAAKEININPKTFSEWVRHYEQKGPSGLRPAKKLTHYTRELKLNAVWDYLDGKGSLLKICQKYQINGKASLLGWIKAYNTYGDFKPDRKEKVTMSKSRKTTQAERLRIVQDCLKREKDYQGMAIKYQVSAQNVRNWVKKYEEMGEAGLEDRRGHRAGSLPSRTKEEQLRDEKAELQRHNDYLQMENDALKKLRDLERGNR